MDSSAVATQFLDHLSEAIQIKTIAHDDRTKMDRSAFDRFSRFLESTYPTTWSTLTVEAISDHALLMTWPGSNATAPPLVLMAHQDVVPVEGSTEPRWSHPPFDGARTRNHLVGRGAIDDKGSLIAIVEAVEALTSVGSAPARTLILAFGHDEEMMGAQGAATIAAILAERGVRAELILDEGGFVTEGVVPATHLPVALVGIAEKGYLDVEISAGGEPGHSSAPPRRTAIGALASAIDALMNKPLPARVEIQADFFEAVAAATRRPAQAIVRAVPRFGRLSERLLARRPTTDALIRTTMAPTVIEGGVKANVLPAAARALVNFRLLPGDTSAAVLEHVRAVVGKEITVNPLQAWEASPVSDTNSHGYRTLKRVIELVFPDAVVAPWIVIGATDARHFSAVSDVVLRFVPFRVNQDELSGFHGINERLRLSDAEPAVRFYRTLIESLCMPTPNDPPLNR